MPNSDSRKAPNGKYRVIGYDQYDYSHYVVEDLDTIEQAIELLKERSSQANAIPTSFSDIYFIYNEKEQALYKASFEMGIEKLD